MENLLLLGVPIIKHITVNLEIFQLFISSIQGPVVQSIVSLMSLLRGQLVKCFMNFLPNTLTIFVKKCEQQLLKVFQQKYWQVSDIKFKILTNH